MNRSVAFGYSIKENAFHKVSQDWLPFDVYIISSPSKNIYLLSNGHVVNKKDNGKYRRYIFGPSNAHCVLVRSCGSSKSIFLLSDRTSVFVLGISVPTNPTINLYTPRQVDIDLDTNVFIKDIACGLGMRGLLLSDGSLKLWGTNRFLGIGKSDNNKSKIIETISVHGSPIVSVTMGCAHTLLLFCRNTERKIFAFGANDFKQLGVSSNTFSVERYPIGVSIPNDGYFETGIRSITCGFYNSTCLTVSHHMYMWGLNDYGQCSKVVNKTIKTVDRPMRVVFDTADLSKCLSVKVTDRTVIALCENPNETLSLYCWGLVMPSKHNPHCIEHIDLLDTCEPDQIVLYGNTQTSSSISVLFLPPDNTFIELDHEEVDERLLYYIVT